MPRDFYDVLGVSRDAGREEIQQAYRRLARQNHPDVNKDPGRKSGSSRSTSIVVDPGAVLAIPFERLRAVAAASPAFADLVLRALLLRRWLALGEGMGFRIIGSR